MHSIENFSELEMALESETRLRTLPRLRNHSIGIFKSHRGNPGNSFISNGKLYDIEMPFTYATVTYNYYAAAAPTSS